MAIPTVELRFLQTSEAFVKNLKWRHFHKVYSLLKDVAAGKSIEEGMKALVKDLNGQDAFISINPKQVTQATPEATIKQKIASAWGRTREMISLAWAKTKLAFKNAWEKLFPPKAAKPLETAHPKPETPAPKPEPTLETTPKVPVVKEFLIKGKAYKEGETVILDGEKFTVGANGDVWLGSDLKTQVEPKATGSVRIFLADWPTPISDEIRGLITKIKTFKPSEEATQQELAKIEKALEEILVKEGSSKELKGALVFVATRIKHLQDFDAPLAEQLSNKTKTAFETLKIKTDVFATEAEKMLDSLTKDQQTLLETHKQELNRILPEYTQGKNAKELNQAAQQTVQEIKKLITKYQGQVPEKDLKPLNQWLERLESTLPIEEKILYDPKEAAALREAFEKASKSNTTVHQTTKQAGTLAAEVVAPQAAKTIDVLRDELSQETAGLLDFMKTLKSSDGETQRFLQNQQQLLENFKSLESDITQPEVLEKAKLVLSQRRAAIEDFKTYKIEEGFSENDLQPVNALLNKMDESFARLNIGVKGTTEASDQMLSQYGIEVQGLLKTFDHDMNAMLSQFRQGNSTQELLNNSIETLNRNKQAIQDCMNRYKGKIPNDHFQQLQTMLSKLEEGLPQEITSASQTSGVSVKINGGSELTESVVNGQQQVSLKIKGVEIDVNNPSTTQEVAAAAKATTRQTQMAAYIKKYAIEFDEALVFTDNLGKKLSAVATLEEKTIDGQTTHLLKIYGIQPEGKGYIVLGGANLSNVHKAKNGKVIKGKIESMVTKTGESLIPKLAEDIHTIARSVMEGLA